MEAAGQGRSRTWQTHWATALTEAEGTKRAMPDPCRCLSSGALQVPCAPSHASVGSLVGRAISSQGTRTIHSGLVFQDLQHFAVKTAQVEANVEAGRGKSRGRLRQTYVEAGRGKQERQVPLTCSTASMSAPAVSSSTFTTRLGPPHAAPHCTAENGDLTPFAEAHCHGVNPAA